MKRFSFVALSLALILSATGALRADDGPKVAPEQGLAPKVRPAQAGSVVSPSPTFSLIVLMPFSNPPPEPL